MDIVVLTWLHLGDRDTLTVHPRDDRSRPLTGVFATRSPDRPNPVGLHRCRILGRNGTLLTVSGLEAVDGTPVVDIKIALGDVGDR
jgi:tRNA-Thr(GGU) m(6)t(6)A37 methyltransferase TsaA